MFLFLLDRIDNFLNKVNRMTLSELGVKCDELNIDGSGERVDIIGKASGILFVF